MQVSSKTQLFLSTFFYKCSVLKLREATSYPIPCVLIALEVNKTKSVRASLREDQKTTVLPDWKQLHNFQKVQMTSNNMVHMKKPVFQSFHVKWYVLLLVLFLSGWSFQQPIRSLCFNFNFSQNYSQQKGSQPLKEHGNTSQRMLFSVQFCLRSVRPFESCDFFAIVFR